LKMPKTKLLSSSVVINLYRMHSKPSKARSGQIT
jgi:hypothetical protein